MLWWCGVLMVVVVWCGGGVYSKNDYYKKPGDLTIVIEQVRKMIADEEKYVRASEAAYSKKNGATKLDPKLSTNAYAAFYSTDWFKTRVVAVSAMSRYKAWLSGYSGFQDMVMNLAVNGMSCHLSFQPVSCHVSCHLPVLSLCLICGDVVMVMW